MQLEHSFTVPVGIDDAWKVLLDIERIAPCMPGAAVDTIDGDDFTGTVKVKLGPIGLTYKGKASFVEKDEAAHRAVIDAQGRDARGNGTARAKVTATLTDQGGDTSVDVVTDLDVTGKPAQFGRGVMADVGNKLIGQFADCLAGKLSGGDTQADQPAAGPAPAAKKTATKSTSKAVAAKKSTRAKKSTAAKKTTAAAETETSAERTGPATEVPAAATAPATDGSAGAQVDSEPEALAAAAPGAAAEPGAAADTRPAAEPGATAETPPATSETPRPAPRTIAPTEVEPIDLLESAGPAVAKRLAPVLAAIVLLLIILRQRRR